MNTNHQKPLPFFAGTISLHLCETEQHLSLLYDLRLAHDDGEVKVRELELADPSIVPTIEAVEQVCNLCGYELDKKQRKWYAPCEYVYGLGSVDFHRDIGYGLVACAVVVTRPYVFTKSPAERNHCSWNRGSLLTKKGDVGAGVGDVLIFDAERLHAWIANCRWVLMCLQVRKTRKSNGRKTGQRQEKTGPYGACS